MVCKLTAYLLIQLKLISVTLSVMRKKIVTAAIFSAITLCSVSSYGTNNLSILVPVFQKMVKIFEAGVIWAKDYYRNVRKIGLNDSTSFNVSTLIFDDYSIN